MLAPGEVYDPMGEPTGDDGGGGLSGFDAKDTYTADEAGTHRLVVGTWSGVLAGYEVEVTRVDDTDETTS